MYGGHLQVIKKVSEQVQSKMPEIDGLPCIGMSALEGTGTPALLPTVVRLYNNWNQQVPTYKLNKWLVEVRVINASLSKHQCQRRICASGCVLPV